MATATVTPGVCGMGIRIEATHDEETGQVTLAINSQCEMGSRLAAELATVQGYEAAFKPAVENPVYQAASKARLHPSCVVPAAIIKVVEIACGLALPRDVSITLAK